MITSFFKRFFPQPFLTSLNIYPFVSLTQRIRYTNVSTNKFSFASTNPPVRGRNISIISNVFMGLIFFIVFFSCTTVHKIPEGSYVRRIHNVPFYLQERFQCGPAALAAVLNYWGVNITPDDISKDILSKNARGTLTLDMLLYAKTKGLNAIQYSGNMIDLRKNLDSQYPVIVLVDLGISLYQANHFMVVVGYTENGVIVNSGRKREVFMPEKEFMKSWRKTDYWTLLIRPQ